MYKEILKPLIFNQPRAELTPEAQAIESTFWILPKMGPKQRFVLNEAQKEYDSIRSSRDIITKCRQKGFSSVGIGYEVVDCLGKEGTRAVLISHEAKSTQRLLDKAAFYLKYMSIEHQVRDYETGDILSSTEIPLNVDLGRHSRQEFYFPKTESTFYIGTAGARAFGRGDTITHLHISEYAWWESDALRQVSGLLQAVPLGGTIRYESTGNGRANDFYYICENAERLGYQLYFRPWWKDNEYELDPKPGWNPDGFEHYFQDMRLEYHLTESQLYWYWMKLLEFRTNLPTMQQEYPSRLDECFSATGGSVFPNMEYLKDERWIWERIALTA